MLGRCRAVTTGTPSATTTVAGLDRGQRATAGGAGAAAEPSEEALAGLLAKAVESGQAYLVECPFQ
jgi:hypothetical protein